MSTTTINHKSNDDVVIMVPPTPGERVLAKLLGEAEVKARELGNEVELLKSANIDLQKRNRNLSKWASEELSARQRYEDLYLEEHHRNRQLVSELRVRLRMPSWMSDLGRFFADVQDAWVFVRRGLSGPREELRHASFRLQWQKR